MVTALFADLVDYVRMIAEHDPEEVRARVGAALRGMADTIERLDGTREKFIGDAVFAVFGWPTAHDDDPIRAALAALAIRATLREPLDGGEAFEVRIGLATGEVVAGSRGDGTGDLAVTGEAITTAARIQSLARPGEILLDEATVRGGRDRLAVDDRGSVVLRGQSSDVHVYALTGEVGLAWPRRHRATPEGPLVGRRDDTARIRKVLRRTKRTGQGAVVLLTGEAGMGKSRLVSDFEGEARDLGFAWTWTENVSYGRGEPYRFARVFAQAVADEHGTDSGSFARQLLFDEETDPATVRRYAGAIAAIARAASFSGWEAEADLVPDDPAETAAILGEVGIAYIERLLEMDGPRVVVLDDVHWIDTSSVGLLELIVSTAAARSLVLVATMRPGPLPAWADLPHVDRIDLAGLRAPETAQLATIVARAALDAQDARRIHERTQGNPLFIGETVRASIEDGTLELRDGRMSLVESRAPQTAVDAAGSAGRPHRRPRPDGTGRPRRGLRHRHRIPGRRAGGPARAADPATDARPAGRFGARAAGGRRDVAIQSTRSSTRPRMPGYWRRADAACIPGWRIGSKSGPGPVSIPALAVHRAASGDAERAIPLLVEAAASAASMGAASEAAGFWRTAAELTKEPGDRARFRDAAESAQAARSR